MTLTNATADSHEPLMIITYQVYGFAAEGGTEITASRSLHE
jgi:hypothetical protein